MECPSRKCFPVLGWTQIVYLGQVVLECAGSSVVVRLSDHGWSGLRHPGDCLLGMQSREVKKLKSVRNSFFLGSRDVCLVAAVVV